MPTAEAGLFREANLFNRRSATILQCADVLVEGDTIGLFASDGAGVAAFLGRWR
jgi:hypothetical protein